MRNRAKCSLCKEIIESFHQYDLMTCKCGEISIEGGQNSYRCSAKNWSNFLRVDDEGNEIIPKVIEDASKAHESIVDEIKPIHDETLDFTELLKTLKNFNEALDGLPQDALYSPVTHSDLSSFVALLVRLFDSLRD